MAWQDDETRIEEIKSRILEFARQREWEQFHSPKNLAMAIAAESGELLEHFLWMDSDASRNCRRDPRVFGKIRQEIADILIFAIEFANMTGMDIAEAIEEKIALNEEKYPVEKARGRSAKYTEL